MTREHIEKLVEEFKAREIFPSVSRGDDAVIVSRENWHDAISFLSRTLDFKMMCDLCGADYPLDKDRFEVVAHLRRMKDGRRLRIKTRLPGERPSVWSISDIYLAANWFEREAFDLFGIKFEGHPNLKRILCHHEFKGHALRKDYPIGLRHKFERSETLLDEIKKAKEIASPSLAMTEEKDCSLSSMTLLNIGPSHPAMHGCFRVLVALDGEKIKSAAAEIGYLHRCFEKEAEDHTWHAIIPYTDRLNYCSPLMNNVGFCMAVEKLLGLEIPERAAWIRMLISEVSRILDHLVCIAANLVDIGALTNYWYLFNARELFTDWIERLCGARLTTNYTRIGGLSRDIPVETEAELGNAVAKLRVALKQVEGLIKKNRIFIDRTQGVGAISENDAVGFGFTGPCLRATGCDYDIRREHPYYFYDSIDWDIPVGTNGDTYDRIFVRMEEMKQSAHMIEQIIEKIPDGAIMSGRRDVTLPPKHEVYGSIEGLIQQFKIVTEGIKPPVGETYSYTEAANGELGFYIVSDGSAKPHRIKVRPPCFAIYQAYPEMIKGHMIADAVAIMGSLNIIAGELDR